MAIPQFSLQEFQLLDLAVIRDLDAAELDRVKTNLEAIKPSPLRVGELRKSLSESLKDKKNAADALLRQSLSLCGLMRQMELSVTELLEAVTLGLTSSADWSDEEIEKWRRLESPFSAVLSSAPLQRVAKTLDLSYEYANLLRRARVVTDIRPVFNKDATQIEGAVISHTLRLRYDSVDGDHGLSIALDLTDINSLLKQCQRAIEKARTAKNLMQTKADVATIVSGEEVNDEE